MTMKDISEKLVSEAHIKRHLLPVGFGLLTKERKGKEIKRRNAAHSSALQIKKRGKNWADSLKEEGGMPGRYKHIIVCILKRVDCTKCCWQEVIIEIGTWLEPKLSWWMRNRKPQCRKIWAEFGTTRTGDKAKLSAEVSATITKDLLYVFFFFFSFLLDSLTFSNPRVMTSKAGCCVQYATQCVY